MAYQVQIEHVAAPQPTAVVRRRAGVRELPKVVPDACGLVWNVLQANQVKGAGRHVSLYLDEQMNLEFGVEMAGPFAGAGEVIPSSLPAGPVAMTVHYGPYNQLHCAHQAIRDWCTQRGYATAGPNWETYGHWVDAWNHDPSQIRTDVFYLLAPGGASAPKESAG
jgi:effector-binding domain-containing protein